MAKTTRIKAPAAKFQTPQTLQQAVDAVAEIGRRKRDCQRIETAMNDELAMIKERFETEATPHKAAIKGLTEGVQAWAEANRHALTDGGRVKTAELASGTLRWRMDPPKVTIKGEEAVLERLRRAGLDRFIRRKEAVAREAIQAEPEAVKGIAGISLEQGEQFSVEPFEADLQAGG